MDKKKVDEKNMEQVSGGMDIYDTTYPIWHLESQHNYSWGDVPKQYNDTKDYIPKGIVSEKTAALKKEQGK